MTFWLYQPKHLFKASSILPFKSKDAGDVLNFLTVFLLSFSMYMKNKIDDNLWRKLLIGGFLLIVAISLLTTKPDDNVEVVDGVEMPKYNDYKFSLSVD